MCVKVTKKPIFKNKLEIILSGFPHTIHVYFIRLNLIGFIENAKLVQKLKMAGADLPCSSEQWVSLLSKLVNERASSH